MSDELTDADLNRILADEECQKSARPYHQLVAEVRRLRAQAAYWRPIETAPEDGDLTADVWAYCSALNSGERHTNAIRRGGKWYGCGGYELNWAYLDADGEPQYRKVTHWMPLPAPPPPTRSPVCRGRRPTLRFGSYGRSLDPWPPAAQLYHMAQLGVFV